MSTRRNFLKTLSGMALLTVVPRHVLGGPKHVAPSDQLTKGIIGVGGISSLMDAELMLEAGADLLQAYSAFIYNGPAWPGRINRALAVSQARRPAR